MATIFRKYLGWTYRYGLDDWIAENIQHPKAKQLFARTLSELKHKIKSHYHNWGW